MNAARFTEAMRVEMAVRQVRRRRLHSWRAHLALLDWALDTWLMLD